MNDGEGMYTVIIQNMISIRKCRYVLVCTKQSKYVLAALNAFKVCLNSLKTAFITLLHLYKCKCFYPIVLYAILP